MKTCPICRTAFGPKTFTNGKRECAARYAERATCGSPTCRREHTTNQRRKNDQTRHHPDRTCEECGTAFNRRRLPNGKLEAGTQFGNRKTCSPACGHARRARKAREDRKNKPKPVRAAPKPKARPVITRPADIRRTTPAELRRTFTEVVREHPDLLRLIANPNAGLTTSYEIHHVMKSPDGHYSRANS